MANEEHVAILKQGVDVWNKWREENPDVRPYLFGAMLYEADLTGVNFNRADLSGAILSKANLSNADISDASLKFAQIGYANLKRANLQDTDCTFAYLVNTDLSEANLSSANFFAAALDGANFKLTKLLMTNLVNAGVKETNFSKAQFGRTNLGHLDLSEARGLESSVHQGRSILGIRSLDYSQGKLPDMFLRGIGWSDAEIEFILPLYKDRVFESYSGFISYSSKDEEFAQRLYNDLQAAEIGRAHV